MSEEINKELKVKAVDDSKLSRVAGGGDEAGFDYVKPCPKCGSDAMGMPFSAFEATYVCSNPDCKYQWTEFI